MNEAFLHQYRVTPESFWNELHSQGNGGYDIIEAAHQNRWNALPDWGKGQWLLGEWPLVVIFIKKSGNTYFVAHYSEGTTEVYACPTRELRNQIIDEIAFFWWHRNNEEWVAGMERIEEARHILGPYHR